MPENEVTELLDDEEEVSLRDLSLALYAGEVHSHRTKRYDPAAALVLGIMQYLAGGPPL